MKPIQLHLIVESTCALFGLVFFVYLRTYRKSDHSFSHKPYIYETTLED